MRWFFRNTPQEGKVSLPRNPLNRRIRIVCPQCSAVNPPASLFCNQCGQRLDSKSVPGLTTGPLSQPSSTLSDAVGERRIVTILFADLVGSTELADEMDPEELRPLLRTYFATMADCVHRHGGIVEKFIGDAIMGVFGLPRTHEDDSARAIRAALDMYEALAQLNGDRQNQDPTATDLRMRIGINTGEVIAATGPAEGNDFLVTGDAVNVAARLQQIAEAGAIVVGPRTYRVTQGIVDYRVLPLAQLKGKPRPIRVWQALGMVDTNPVPLARSRSLDAPRTSLIGRDVETDIIQSIYARVMSDRQPHVVTVIGTPGIGKTRLAREFIAQTRDDDPPPIVMSGRCAIYGEGITLWPIIEMLRDCCGITATTPPEEARETLLAYVTNILRSADRVEDPTYITALLCYTIGIETAEQSAKLPQDAKQLQSHLRNAWRTFFEAHAAHNSLILLIDDIHWADDALLNMIEVIANRSNGYPIMIICTARSELLQRHPDWGGGKRNYSMLTLEPLTVEQSSHLVADFLEGVHLPPELHDNIVRRAEGNPFFIEEIIRMLVERGVLVPGDDGQWEASSLWAESDEITNPVIPDTVQGVLAARIDVLTPDEREILSYAAVIGRGFWPSALAAMAPHMSLVQIQGILQLLVKKEFIFQSQQAQVGQDNDEPQYSFKYMLIRDVTYDTIPRTRRAHEHEQFAEWLERLAVGREGEFAEQLARHYEEYYRQGSLARSRNADRRQVIRDKILNYLEIAGDTASHRYATLTATKDYSRAIALLREDFVGAGTQLLTLYVKRGDAWTLRSDGDAAWSDYRTALHLWQAESHTIPGSYTVETTNIGVLTERQSTATMSQLGMRIYRRLVTLPARYASWFRKLPSPEELRGYLQAGLRLAEEAGDMESLDRASLLTAKTFFWWSWSQGRGQEEIRDALESAEEAVAITERLHAPKRASEALDALGNMQAATTDLIGHLRSQARRLYWAQQIDDRNEIVDIHCEVSAAHQMVGEYQKAIDHARIASEMAESLDNDILRVQSLQRLTIAYYEWDRWSDAINDGEQMLAIGPRTTAIAQNHYRWGALAVIVSLARTGRMDRVDQLRHTIDDLPVIAESQYVGVFRARLQLARGNFAEGEQLLRTALTTTAGRHIYPALLAELAELGARLGRRDLTNEFGHRAIDIGQRSGAHKPYAQALRARGLVALSQGDFTIAKSDLLSALERYEQLGTLWEEARTRYVLAELERRVNNPARAERELKRALHLFEQVGAIRDIARAKNALAGGDIRLP